MAAARRPGIVRPASGATARAGAQAPGLAPQEGPCPGDVTFFRTQVAHGQADREPAGQSGVRQEDLARPVDGGHDPGVQLVEPGVHGRIGRGPGHPGWPEPEADRREWHRRESLPVRVGVDPLGELGRQGEVVINPFAQALEPKGSQQDPQLQGAEAPAELGLVFAVVADRRLAIDRPEVLGLQAEGRLEQLHPARKQERCVEWREQPLVRIDHDRIGQLPTLE